MTVYELTTLSTQIAAPPKAAPKIEAWLAAPEAKGELLGAWFSDIGQLNQVFLLRGYGSAEEMQAERRRSRRAADPFGCADLLTGVDLVGYEPLDFLGPVETGALGPIYEIRSYLMKADGVPATTERWRKALPARLEYSGLVTAMTTTDGPLRFTHIWPYSSIEDRQRIRASAAGAGIWPPEGGPLSLQPDMRSTIVLPLSFSPLS